jgi:hypothetical protein
MTIYYLMVKTHTITGLKYLCQTKRKDPTNYLGSGVRWWNHLSKHGKTVSTEILRECHSKDELKKWGIHYSELWNVVTSNDWANIKPENGDGGFAKPTQEMIKKRIETRKRNGTMNVSTPERISKGLETKRKNGTMNVCNSETVSKRNATRKLKGTKHNPNSPNSNAKRMNTMKENGTGFYARLVCYQCEKSFTKQNYSRWHGEKCRYPKLDKNS